MLDAQNSKVSFKWPGCQENGQINNGLQCSIISKIRLYIL